MTEIDLLDRKKRLQMRTSRRHHELYSEFQNEDLANSCFKLAVCETLEEDQWKTILEKTRELLNLIGRKTSTQ